MKWKRVLQGPINGELNDYLEKLIETEIEKGNTVKVCVGTDSQRRGRGYNFATVIVLEIKKPIGTKKDGSPEYKGQGAMVVVSETYDKNYTRHMLNERMIKEVELTVEAAYHIYPLLDLYGIELELHADINQNPKHGSNVALKSAVGYMSGIPCNIKVKPDAYAASTSADKLC